MTYDTKAVANYFLELAEANRQTVSPMKLLKLLYFAHGWYLAIAGKPLLNEAIQAWSYGPVVPSIYHEFKHFGNDSITTPAKGAKRIEGGDEAFVRKLLQKVWDIYSPFTAVQLSRMTHQEGSPWSETVETYKGSEDYFPHSMEIEDGLIKEYFVASRHSD